MLLVLNFLVLKNFFSLLNDTLSHLHHLFHVLILKIYDLLEGLLIHGNHPAVFLIHAVVIVGAGNLRQGETRLDHLLISWHLKRLIRLALLLRIGLRRCGNSK